MRLYHQSDILLAVEPSYSVYCHIPFCRHRCGYCDFNTFAGLGALIPDYVLAMRQEMAAIHQTVGKRLTVHSVFFGGGTPSLLSPAQFDYLLTGLDEHFALAQGAEISLEANPGTVSLQGLSEMHASGVNRLSLGVQSANPEELRLLERQHNFLDVIHAVGWARQAGFEQLNLDLIFGLPFQTLADWQRTLERVAGLQPEHLSLYALSVEANTPLEALVRRGLVESPDPDRAADMYEWATDWLGQRGWEPYEISNWAKRSPAGNLLACRHNLQYWRGLPYLGLGAGAHGYAAGIRTENVLSPSAYILRMTRPDSIAALPRTFPLTPVTQVHHTIGREAEIGETMMMGLRLVEEGVAEAAFAERFGEGLEARFSRQITRLSSLGLLEWVGEVGARRLRLTRGGRLLGNQVFVEFI